MNAQDTKDTLRRFLEALTREVPESVLQADDDELEQRAIAGDDLAFKALIVKYGAEIARVISRRERIDANVDEMVQDVIMKVNLALPDKPADSPFRYWIKTVAKNYAIDEQERGDKKKEGAQVELTDDIQKEHLLNEDDERPAEVEAQGPRKVRRPALLYAETHSLNAAMAFLEALCADDWRERLRLPDAQDHPGSAAESLRVPRGSFWDQIAAAMTFLSVLAYPEDKAARDRAIFAMETQVLRAHKLAGRELPPDMRTMLDMMPPQQQANTLGRMAERLGNRQMAAYAATMLLGQFQMPGREVSVQPAERQKIRFQLMGAGRTPAQAHALAPETKREPGDFYTLNDLAGLFRKSRRTFFAAVWKPEVLHLALAFQTVARRWPQRQGFGVLALLADPAWVADALTEAERWAVVLVRASQAVPALAGVRPESQTRLIPDP